MGRRAGREATCRICQGVRKMLSVPRGVVISYGYDSLYGLTAAQQPRSRGGASCHTRPRTSSSADAACCLGASMLGSGGSFGVTIGKLGLPVSSRLKNHRKSPSPREISSRPAFMRSPSVVGLSRISLRALRSILTETSRSFSTSKKSLKSCSARSSVQAPGVAIAPVGRHAKSRVP